MDICLTLMGARWGGLPGPRRTPRPPHEDYRVEEVADAVARLATDESLAGRILVWWSDDAPGLIPWCDPGHGELTPHLERE